MSTVPTRIVDLRLNGNHHPLQGIALSIRTIEQFLKDRLDLGHNRGSFIGHFIVYNKGVYISQFVEEIVAELKECLVYRDIPMEMIHTRLPFCVTDPFHANVAEGEDSG